MKNIKTLIKENVSNVVEFFHKDQTESLVMDQPVVESLLDRALKPLVGQPISRIEGHLKVSGRATYSAEYQLDDVLYGFLVSAPFAKGKITAINQESALRVEGVVAVIQDKKFLSHPQQASLEQAPKQDIENVIYFGQPVALVVANSFEAARDGAANLELRYNKSQGAFDFDQEKSNAKPIDLVTDKSETKNDPEDALKQAEVKIDSIYTTPSQSNAPMEPHASIASWQGDYLTIYTSLQVIASCKLQVADALGIKPDDVRLISHFVGGGFGSKLAISPDIVAAAIAAKQLGRPVKVVMSRPQVFESTVRRSNTLQRVALGADKDGTIHTIIHNSIVSNLPNQSYFEPVAIATHFLYQGKHRQVQYKQVAMNQVLSASMRAPGEAVGMLGLECAIDDLAVLLKMDPVELRLRNIPHQNPSKEVLFSTHGLAQALQKGAEKFGWNKRSAVPASQREGDWLLGMGVASAARSNLLNTAEANVILTQKGKVIVETDMTDIGTGSYTILAQIAADLLGVALSEVDVRLGDSNFPKTGGAGGSWGACSSGSAVYLACKSIREQIANKLELPPEQIEFNEGKVKTLQQEYALNEIMLNWFEGDLKASGKIEKGKNEENYTQAGFGANFAEVAVNAITGEVRVRRMLGVFSAGRILNEKTARSQCYGGMIFGIGGALMEQLIHDPRDGRVMNHDLGEYHIPVNADVPPIEVEFLAELDPLTNPLHAKGIGELGISGAGAAIANAVYNATGVRVYDYPITMEKLLDQLPAV